MSERLSLALLLVGVGLVAVALLRRHSPLGPLTLAMGMTVACGVFYPVATIWIEPFSWRRVHDLAEASILGTQADYLAFGVGLLTAIGLSTLIWRRALASPVDPPPPTRRQVFRDCVVSLGLVLVGGLLYAQFVREVGLATLTASHDFASKYLAARGLGIQLIGLKLMIAGCLWGEAGEVPRRLRRFLRCLALAIAAWSILFIAVRTYAVALGLGYVMIFARDRHVELRQLKPGLLVALLLAYAGSEAYALLRSSWNATGNLGSAVQMAMRTNGDQALGALVGGSELSHPFLTLAEVREHEESGVLAGQSYVDAVLAFVPLVIWDERPQTLAQIYVQKYYPAIDERGGGTAFSFVAEAWWNFGRLFGPWFVGTAIGLFLLTLHQRSRLHPHGFANRFLPYLTYILILMHRNQASSLFKQVMAIALPCIGLALAAEVLWRSFLARHHRPRALRVPSGPRLVTGEEGA